MKIGSIMWNSHISVLIRAGKGIDDLELIAYSSRDLENDPLVIDEALEKMADVDLLLFYRSTEGFWERIEEKLKKIGEKIPIVCVGHDPSYWMLSTVSPKIVADCYRYITMGGEDNFQQMILYLGNQVLKVPLAYNPPGEVPWEGLYHPQAPGIFHQAEEYLSWYRNHLDSTKNSYVGILFTRQSWANQDLAVENNLILEFEKLGFGVIPVFSYSVRDEALGSRGSAAAVRDYFFTERGNSRIEALIKLQAFFLGRQVQDRGGNNEEGNFEGIEIFKKLDVPVFSPVVTTYRTVEEWKEDPQGLSSEIGWNVAMPEFEGVIEPIIIGAMEKENDGIKARCPIKDRCSYLVQRVAKWIALAGKPVSERKIAFILHNNPCASVEASVGGGAGLDTLESVAQVLHAMKKRGYTVNPPADGKDLINTIMERKAISEFRWTPIEEIIQKGGALDLVSKEEYNQWFETISPKVQERMIEAWGNPPGEAKNDVPAAMVYDGKIVVTGVTYGNAVVCVQPKRGCAGARCDGQVCKILHDPDIPPPHQYMATYRYLENRFGADAIVHVGTHGNLEFLPGKGVGLSAECYPDLGIGRLPHLYIYNADNPAEGIIAKRRSYATLVDHMQTVMTVGGLYEGLEELDRHLSEYQQAKVTDKGRSHVLEHMIHEGIKKNNLEKEMGPVDGLPFPEVEKKAHEVLSRIRNTQIQDGLHVFGQPPQGDRKISMINSILKYDADQDQSLRKVIAGALGLDMHLLLEHPEEMNDRYQKSHGQLLEAIDRIACFFIARVLEINGSNGGIVEAASSRLNIKEDAKGSDPEPLLWQAIQEIMASSGLPLPPSPSLPLSPNSLSGQEKTTLFTLRYKIMALNGAIEDSREIDSLLHGQEGGYIPAGPSGLITRGRPDILPTGRNFYSLDPYRVPTQAAWRVGQRLSEAVVEKHLKDEGRIPQNVAIYWMAGDIMYADGEGMAQIMALLGVKPVWQPNGRIKGFEVIPLSELGRPRIDVTIRLSGITRDNFPNCVDLIDEAVQTVASLDEPSDMNFPRQHALQYLREQLGQNDDADYGENRHSEMWRKATFHLFSAKPGTYSAGVQLAVYASAWKEEKDLSDIFVFWNGYAYGKGVKGVEAFGSLHESLRTVDATFNKVVTDEKDLFGCCCYFGAHGGMTTAARHISGHEVKTYYGDTREPEHVEVRDLSDEIRRVVRTKLLNPKWIEGMKRHGYKGASTISKRIGRVYGWESTTQEVDDWIFDDITKTFVLDEEMRAFFKEHNPWALEEIGRRLIEAEQRGLWKADPEVMEELKNIYLEIEGDIEERMGDVGGEFQGGAIDIMTPDDVADWGAKMNEIKEKLKPKP